MSLPITTGRGRAQGRLEKQELYDQEGLRLATATTQLSFFSNTLGGADGSTMITSKTIGDTNINQAGQLSAGQEMTVDSLFVRITPAVLTAGVLSAPTAAAPATITESDLLTIYFRSWLTFTISGIIVYQGPLINVASGTGILFSGNSTADTRSLYTNGTGHATSVNSVTSKAFEYGYFAVPSGERVTKAYQGQKQLVAVKSYAAYPTIDQNENFAVTINWPGAITLAGSALVQVFLGGYFLRPM